MYSDVRDTYPGLHDYCALDRLLLRRCDPPDHQHILVYLLLFIVLETFIFIKYESMLVMIDDAMSLFVCYSLFVAVIVDNLARTQAAANASKPRPKAVKVCNKLPPSSIH